MQEEPDSNETRTIRELLEIMHEHDLDAIKVKMGDQTYELVRREGAPSVAMPMPAAAAAPPGGTVAAGHAAAPANTKKVVAPLVGVFYRSPAPGAEMFVNIGDRVEVGQVLCILEAMKLMNEITSDYAGVITRILPENGELVSLGEEMFWIEP